MEVIKEFVIKSYVDASILKVGAIILSCSVQSIVDIEICEIHTDLNVADP